MEFNEQEHSAKSVPLKGEDFGKFVNNLVKARVIDNSYPVKGCYVWLPYGFELKEKVFSMIEEQIKKNDYKRYQFPRLIPGSAIRKVTSEIDDFESGLFWLRNKNGTPMDLFLNPTGECGVYTMFKKWISHESDLPLKVYQIGATFRPHKRPDVLLNGDELTNLLEAHSAFSSKQEADQEFFKLSHIFKNIHEIMGIPYLLLRRPIHGNKPVCVDMFSFETYLPSKQSSFNVGVLYNQSQIYSKAFNINFSTQKRNIKHLTHQVTFGISERGIAAMLDIHRDKHGLRLLPEFAPIQILVIPVYGEGEDKSILEYAFKIADYFIDYRTEVDTTNRRAGKVFAEARQKGIPLRIGISQEDLTNNTIRLYLRTQDEPYSGLSAENILAQIPTFMKTISLEIKKEASNYLKDKIDDSKDLKDLKEIVAENRIARFFWCGSTSCLISLSKLIQGEIIGSEIKNKNNGFCFVCGKQTYNPSYYAKRGASP